MATLTEAQLGRRNKKRSRDAVERAVQLFNSATPNIRADQRRSALKTVRASGRPLATAKALAKKFRAASLRVSYAAACPDLSAAQEARVSLIRGQHPLLQAVVPYEDDLGALERDLVTGKIGQETFNRRCQAISEREHPNWMQDYTPACPLSGAQSPIECIPSDGLHKALGLSLPSPGEDGSDVTGPMPGFLDRRRTTPIERENNREVA